MAIPISKIIETALDLLPAALTLFASILYIARSVGTDSILMVVGSALGLVMAIVWIVIWPMLWESEDGFRDQARIEVIRRVLYYIGIGSRLLFLTGLLLLVLKQGRQRPSSVPPNFR